MDKWFSLFGVPEPMPIPRGNYLKEIEFSMNAYLKSLWIPEEDQWWEVKGGGLLSRKGRPSFFLYDLYQGYLLSPSPVIRKKCKDLLDRITTEYGVEIRGEDLGFTFSNPISSMQGMAMYAISLLNQQGEDGAWKFRAPSLGAGVFAGYDYRLLGQHNAVEVGTCAHNAYQVLRSARMIGEAKLLEAGLRALKYMKRFKVPRGGQVWEVPVHTPEILSASDAVEAYIEGFRATGKIEYLVEAKKWARRGLPFIYFWNEGRFPFMRYASLVGFGASFYTTSWFGKPVQWCGLRLAYALLKLSDYDNSFPWKKIAEGIIRSALYQQEEEGENIALWPDNISVISGEKSSWLSYPLFTPVMILKGIYKLLERDSEPKTIKTGYFFLNYKGKIRNVRLAGKKLSFEIMLPKGEPGSIVLARIGNFSDILINGKKCSFDYKESMALLRVTLNQEEKWQTVEISGISPKFVNLVPDMEKRRKIDFKFEKDNEGWIAINDIRLLPPKNGVLEGFSIGPDPYMVRIKMDVKGETISAVKIRMKVSKGRAAEFYWTTEDSPFYDEQKSIKFPLFADGEFHEYVVRLERHPMWKERKITSIRLDPTDLPSAFFSIEYITGDN
jgi:hypothetical protein